MQQYGSAMDDLAAQRMFWQCGISRSIEAPDDAGIHIDGPIGLGHRRLSILDLSAAGHQPMSNEDGSIWLVFNGEIYNYIELASTLREHGHIFRSATDSEVILHLYEEEGRVACSH
ncbi:MAG: hypothetical protein IPP54_03360 [Anaerolineales bacterium]|nr:hypothetical protein [Anaerolineales bacterium]